MDWILYIVATVFAFVGLGCIILVIFQLPGAWIMWALAVVIELCDKFYLTVEPGETPETFGWMWLGITAGLLALGELIEFIASIVGAKKGGASKRGMMGSLIGGILGALVLQVFIPIPIFGALVGAVIGTFIGAVVGEMTGDQPKKVGESIKPAIGAAIGRSVAAISKVGIALVVWIVLVAAAFWP